MNLQQFDFVEGLEQNSKLGCSKALVKIHYAIVCLLKSVILVVLCVVIVSLLLQQAGVDKDIFNILSNLTKID